MAHLQPQRPCSLDRIERIGDGISASNHDTIVCVECHRLCVACRDRSGTDRDFRLSENDYKYGVPPQQWQTASVNPPVRTRNDQGPPVWADGP